MNILHAMTDPTLPKRSQEMLVTSGRTDIAVRYLFMSGFEAVADDLSRPKKVRILVACTDLQGKEAAPPGASSWASVLFPV